MADKISLPVTDLVITSRFVEIDPVCPSCGADLMAKDALVTWEYQDQKRHGNFSKETNQLECNEYELPSAGEVYLPVGYRCTGCDVVLAEGNETDTVEGAAPIPASEVHEIQACGPPKVV